jgi:formylglycine-generating enzyme required for sulfatase activity
VIYPRLAQLGFTERVVDGVEVIIPPVCDVPAGAFPMGSDPAHDKEAYGDEMPRHRVTLPAFQIGRHPVTVAEYVGFVRAGHAEPQASDNARTWRGQLRQPDRPVMNVSWHDAVAYAAWLARVTGAPWRLPTEAEWEKAARWDAAAGRARLYPWGDAFDQARCNTYGSGKRRTTPVGSYPNGASPCGAEDMAGNVWEWTSGLFAPYPYRADDGKERADSADDRVSRGGSWDFDPSRARAAARYPVAPDYGADEIGFRLACAVTGG